jgi:hypothetical protein
MEIQEFLNLHQPKTDNQALEEKLRPQGDRSTAKAANPVVVIEISVSGGVKGAGKGSNSRDCSWTLVKQIKDFGSQLEVETSVRAESCVFQHHQIRTVETIRAERISLGSSGTITG